jgi:hypothetical protein
MLSVLPEAFDGGMKINKYMSLTHTTKITAGRDLSDLVEKDSSLLLEVGVEFIMSLISKMRF